MDVEVHIHGRPHPGETLSGDAGGVHRVDGVTWVMVLDALGHGPEAAKVGMLALDELTTFTAAMTTESAFRRLNKRVEGTRGAAAALLRFDAAEISLVGIGNVELRTLAGDSLPYIPAKGILGRRVGRVRARELSPSVAGRMVLFTDGIERRAPIFQLAERHHGLELCETLIREHALDRDDALVAHVAYRL